MFKSYLPRINHHLLTFPVLLSPTFQIEHSNINQDFKQSTRHQGCFTMAVEDRAIRVALCESHGVGVESDSVSIKQLE